MSASADDLAGWLDGQAALLDASGSIHVSDRGVQRLEAAASLIRSQAARIEKLEEAGVHLCAAVDNLWNHPDLVRVRAEIPESIKLNISRGQMMTRAALERT